MLLPDSVPLTVLGPPVDRLMLPLRADPVWVQVRVNVPEKAPLYVPFQVPESPPADAAGVGVGEVVISGVVALVAGAGGLVVALPAGGVVDPVPVLVLLLQPNAVTASTATRVPSISPDEKVRRTLSSSRSRRRCGVIISTRNPSPEALTSGPGPSGRPSWRHPARGAARP